VALAAEGFPAVLGMGAVNGVLFLSGFLLLQINTRKNGIVLSSIFMKLGLLVPVALSVFLFGEIPTAVQIFGFCLAVGAIILINFDKNAVTAGSKVGLILMLLAAGTGDAMAKVFEVFGPTELSNQFLFVTFAFAVSFTAFHLESNQFGAAELFHDFTFHFGISNKRSSHLQICAFTHCKDFTESDFGSGFAFDTFHGNNILFLDLELFSACGDHCVH
jgi:multidrug transporter EmrE-like cation transporter